MAVTQSLHENLRRDTPPLPDYVNHYALAANTDEGVTPPADAAYAWFRADGDVYGSYGTAVVPASDVTDGTGSFLLPQDWPVAIKPGVAISVIASATRLLTVGYYRTFTTL